MMHQTGYKRILLGYIRQFWNYRFQLKCIYPVYIGKGGDSSDINSSRIKIKNTSYNVSHNTDQNYSPVSDRSKLSFLVKSHLFIQIKNLVRYADVQWCHITCHNIFKQAYTSGYILSGGVNFKNFIACIIRNFIYTLSCVTIAKHDVNRKRKLFHHTQVYHYSPQASYRRLIKEALSGANPLLLITGFRLTTSICYPEDISLPNEGLLSAILQRQLRGGFMKVPLLSPYSVQMGDRVLQE